MYESIYPWDKWMDGHAWKVRQGSDFSCYGLSFASTAHGRAALVGLSVTASVFEYDYDDDIVFFQFFDGAGLWKPNLRALPDWRKEKERHSRRQIMPRFTY